MMLVFSRHTDTHEASATRLCVAPLEPTGISDQREGQDWDEGVCVCMCVCVRNEFRCAELKSGPFKKRWHVETLLRKLRKTPKVFNFLSRTSLTT